MKAFHEVSSIEKMVLFKANTFYDGMRPVWILFVLTGICSYDLLETKLTWQKVFFSFYQFLIFVIETGTIIWSIIATIGIWKEVDIVILNLVTYIGIAVLLSFPILFILGRSNLKRILESIISVDDYFSQVSYNETKLNSIRSLMVFLLFIAGGITTATSHISQYYFLYAMYSFVLIILYTFAVLLFFLLNELKYRFRLLNTQLRNRNDLNLREMLKIRNGLINICEDINKTYAVHLIIYFGHYFFCTLYGAYHIGLGILLKTSFSSECVQMIIVIIVNSSLFLAIIYHFQVTANEVRKTFSSNHISNLTFFQANAVVDALKGYRTNKKVNNFYSISVHLNINHHPAMSSYHYNASVLK